MFKPILDYDDGDYIYQTSASIGIDSDGDLHMRIVDNMILMTIHPASSRHHLRL